jgi:ABC-type multidrug transport system fused ATPase/permease subunit
MQNIQLLSASYNRIDAFLKEPEQSIDKTNIKIKKVKGAITFKNVEFSYNENNPIINNFSINIPAGSKVAIVGPTGAGKTTIVNLLMRFYEINKGQITIDGVDTKKMNREYLTSLFAMVLQDP